jgi:Tol biopolymer transport system component/predicted Ser/Thr protein kinase
MGEVYRAKDSTLKRDVALKVLPTAFAKDPERMARFQREAEVLASLNHPNIAAIYGVIESDNTRALVMELVEGETLKGPLPIDTALNYAQQIVSALEAAHEKGIAHRDLKPANIMITPAGVVKVLDFGLAKASEEPATHGSNPSNSPTLTLAATSAGVIMGTAGYMSPEQAAGKPADKRADIWAFGVVLWEMLTGKRLFDGETISHTLAAVLTKQPSLDEVPPKVRRLLRSCLEKDVKKRLRDIGDAWRQLEDEPVAARPARRGWLWSAVAAGSLAAAVGTLAWTYFRPSPQPQVMRFEIHAPPGSKLPLGTPAISPDGRTLAYMVTGPDSITRIHVRPLHSLESRALPGTEGAIHPFWSPDGRSLGFSADGKIKRIDLAGGRARELSETQAPWHGTWNRGGVILFIGSQVASQIPADGGPVTPVAKLDEKRGETGVGFPHFLSDGRRFLVGVSHGDGRSIELATLGSFERKTVVKDAVSAPILAPTPDGKSYLLYLREPDLVAQEFDQASGTVRGNAVVLVDNIGRVATPAVMPSVGVSPSGTLAYQTAGEVETGHLAWFDRTGKVLSELPSAAAGEEPVLSPDGRLAAVQKISASGRRDVWLTDFDRGASTRLTFNTNAFGAAWSPDGKRLAYRGNSDKKVTGIYERDASGAGQERLLAPGNGVPSSWSPDGQYILYGIFSGAKLFLLPLAGDKKPIPVGSPNGASFLGSISPDSKYIAFISNESGRLEVYVQPMPLATGKWQISVNGGTQPKWRRDGKELFFLSLDRKMMAVDLNLGPAVKPGVPHELFQTAVSNFTTPHYDVSVDGQRFLIYLPSRETADAPIAVVLNWPLLLKK